MTATAPRRTSTPPAPSGSPVTTYYLLVAGTAILVLVGLALVLSTTSNYALRADSGASPYRLFITQAVALVIGMGGLVAGSHLSLTWWKRLAPWTLLASYALLALVLVAGKSVNGNKNWLIIGGMSFQPSEFAKLGLALFLGVTLATFRRELTTLKGILIPGGVAAALVLLLVLAGGDLGTAMVICLLVGGAYWVAGMPLRYFLVLAAAGVGMVLYMLEKGTTRGSRIDVWLNPENCDPQGSCMQAIHGLWALASGGLWGLGPGMSREKWAGLPAADNDFIFAVIGEEFGLIGTGLVLIAFGMIAVAINRLVRRHRDPFVQIASGAIGAWIVGQALINIAVVIGLLPVTGVPLPLVSSGGSSLIVSLAAIGVLLAFARHEPGAQEAFAARPSMIKRSIAIVSRGRRG
ncbi:FtsW/RodA/SpoVE family cell cycle protein [Demequina sp. NBRC 110057]|uniref:FtsW/RodA/SpoVE family cell cycle protein n=1 Tax=Demequina sp. NBRC 110057 TaxID=1570346 RepID=UPI000A07998B|nr:putative peptidoglycan glycosyltransferase FtsW [Demequina sp. NBRC 110057]